jgi:hypothetical protein
MTFIYRLKIQARNAANDNDNPLYLTCWAVCHNNKQLHAKICEKNYVRYNFPSFNDLEALELIQPDATEPLAGTHTKQQMTFLSLASHNNETSLKQEQK